MTNNLTKILRSSSAILAFSVLYSPEAYSQSCVTPPTCEELGYKQSDTDCAGTERVLKCPFNKEKMFCKKTSVNTETCLLGAILYSDKSCSTNKIDGKTPIGIVFDTNKRLAVALEDASSTLVWGGYDADIPGLDNCETVSTCGTDGKANTKAIIDFGKSNSISYPAAEYCNNYTTTGTSIGDWFLPSMAEFESLYNAKTYVNATLQLLGKSELTSGPYWSSNEFNISSSWEFNMPANTGTYSYKYINYSSNVRPVLAF